MKFFFRKMPEIEVPELIPENKVLVFRFNQKKNEQVGSEIFKLLIWTFI